jgi:hypothetical protein
MQFTHVNDNQLVRQTSLTVQSEDRLETKFLHTVM